MCCKTLAKARPPTPAPAIMTRSGCVASIVLGSGVVVVVVDVVVVVVEERN